MKKFYITTPIYYVNDKPHIGHAYTTVAADVLARWKRISGEQVFFLTGTDEHGTKIAQVAAHLQSSTQDYVDRLALEFQSLWKILNISNDDFIRTTEDRHRRVVQNVFQKLYEKGEIYKGFYEDWYCVSCESFCLESQVVNGNCPECGRPVEKLREESYFFKLSSYQDSLLQFYEKNKDFLSPPHRAQEILNFVRSGLKDLSVSRLKEKWGIPVPFDSKHTVYVWFDALLNYVTAGGDAPSEWPCDVHLVGKEILRFHAVIWPAMLMALEIPLPKKVFAHGWWTVEGEKMSKSRGNVVDPVAVANEFGVDSFRYFLLREIPFGTDGDFSRKSLLARYNADLANNLGNLFARTLTLIEKNFSSRLSKKPEGIFSGLILEKSQAIVSAYENLAFHEVLENIFFVVTEANRYLENHAPWKLVKTDREKCETALAECLLVLRWLAAALHPFMPSLTVQMWEQLGEISNLPDVAHLVFQNPLEKFAEGNRVQKGAILFPRKSV
ncbi:MAG: methionine--tRNA ligase [Elusimicrobia bacterium]|nr:methionine--tRNA ligase [Elusimicrobiota bacterium]